MSYVLVKRPESTPVGKTGPHVRVRPPTVSRGLRVSDPHSPLERAADEVAARVMSGRQGHERPVRREGAEGLMRACSSCMEEEIQREPATASDGATTAETAVQEPLKRSLDAERRSGGAPLSSEVRAFMEPRFGQSFGEVRLHVGERPSSLARDLRARAFTVGQDVFFRAGQYQPSTSSGRRLIAHELTHTIQQSSGGAAIQRSPAPDADNCPQPGTGALVGPDGQSLPERPEAGKFYYVHPSLGLRSLIRIGKAAGIDWRTIEASTWNRARYWDPTLHDNLRKDGGLTLTPHFAWNGGTAQGQALHTGKCYPVLWIPSASAAEPPGVAPSPPAPAPPGPGPAPPGPAPAPPGPGPAPPGPAPAPPGPGPAPPGPALKISPRCASLRFKNTEIEQAMAQAKVLAANAWTALSTLSAMPAAAKEQAWNAGAFKCWFGIYDEKRFDKILANYAALVGVLDSGAVKIYCSEGKGYGAANPGIYRIRLFRLWRDATSQHQLDERIQTFIHESAHIGGVFMSREGRYYEEPATLALAKKHPERSVKHADAYGYFAMNMGLTPPNC